MGIHSVRRSRKTLSAFSYAASVYESLDTPRSLACYMLLKHGEHAQLARLSIDARHYLDTSDLFFRDYQSTKLLSKFPNLQTGIDVKAVAKEKFLWAEDSCRRTNERFRARDLGHVFNGPVERVLSRAQHKIGLILGDVPSFDRLAFDFGPGAAYGVRGETSVFNKVVSPLECTYAFARILPEFLGEFPGWIREDTATVQLVQGSQLTFVPKDAKTDRPICIEPLLNGLYQKGVGSYIRDRLQRFGISLRDQGVNQKLASLAHVNGLATVDFSSASDTISYRTVMDLLPFDWFEFLDVARSPRYLDGDSWFNFQKFSSMGNAYTFELETLIFYALACACCEELSVPYVTGQNVSVFGDDVIIPASCYDLFSEVTVACGFHINEEKSFRDGLFFESCGHDYFAGAFVRPILLKKKLDKLTSTFYAINGLRRIKERFKASLPVKTPGSDSVSDSLDDYWSRAISTVPVRLRRFGPEGYGDGHIVADLDFAMSQKDVCRLRSHPTDNGWWFKSFAEVGLIVKRDDWPSAYALHSAMHHRESTLMDPPQALRKSEGYVVRGRTRLVEKRLSCYSDWHSSYDAYERQKEHGVMGMTLEVR